MEDLSIRANKICEIMKLSNSLITPILDSWVLTKFRNNGYYTITDEFIFLLEQRLQQKHHNYSTNITRLKIWQKRQQSKTIAKN